MGCFDYVEVERRCPMCGSKIKRFQTKSIANMMITYGIGDKVEKHLLYDKTPKSVDEIEIHQTCSECKTYVSMILKVVKDRLKDEVELQYFLPKDKEFVVEKNGSVPRVYKEKLEVISYEEYLREKYRGEE